MPFSSLNKRTFQRESIDQLQQGLRGCYGLFREEPVRGFGSGILPPKELCIRVGQSIDIRRRLIEYLNDDDACVSLQNPAFFYFEQITPQGFALLLGTTDDLDARERALITEYNPICNRLFP